MARPKSEESYYLKIVRKNCEKNHNMAEYEEVKAWFLSTSQGLSPYNGSLTIPRKAKRNFLNWRERNNKAWEDRQNGVTLPSMGS